MLVWVIQTIDMRLTDNDNNSVKEEVKNQVWYMVGNRMVGYVLGQVSGVVWDSVCIPVSNRVWLQIRSRASADYET